ncbi:sulfatase-like hydrolase/transferase [Chryseobacterium salivictor]|uniref:Poly-beta-1,6-N-acetyl-D-glucosamine synthase n=1 Tax=Chryseobacterium salivictor TaxID=2547600 RepID=A0A4V1AKS3_9FLAO|nr:sulfatase-like hydrolase/transferase [Chryseobacterium salivictor]QBO57264.1 Poly-beta-1,6-N-acetyl-D-glucosamine synthase [Chryseobacterium salivictor]
MLAFSQIIYELIIWLFLLYGTAVFLVYGWIGIYALGAVIRYKKENTFTDYSIIASNPNALTFSVIAPAYNEGMTIVENVRSLLSLYYHNLEIIIVNDGSKDDSILKLIEAYELEAVSFFVQGEIETNKIREVYKSKNPAFKKLIIVDKDNGGKADALNVGVNISSGEYLVCIDVDCILEQDAILKLAKPFLEQTDKKLIACGGIIRLANNCKIENGKVTDINIPKTLLGRTQALEYIRAFVLGRMAWSRASGLILISGAFGVFDRKIVLACGGYDRKTVGEDMELVVRMRKYMEEQNEPYEVITIPDPLCWTEAPETKDILKKQRNRWMRGTMETLWKHRKLMFNPKYGKLGMISLPYWFFFEFLGPLVEFLGYVIFIVFLILGIINWPFFIILFALVISSGFLFSIYGILVDLLSHQVYAKRKDFLALIGTALLEPFYFHPLVVKAGVSGFIDYFKKSHTWGEMTRQGFHQNHQNLPFKKRVWAKLQLGLHQWGLFAGVFLLLFSVGTVSEWIWYRHTFQTLNSPMLGEHLLLNNLIFVLKLIMGSGLIYLILNFLKESWAKTLIVLTFTLVIVTHYLLFIYFSESHNLLGADILYYSKAEMKQILEASGMLSYKNFALLGILVTLSFIPFWFASKSSFKPKYVGAVFLGLGAISFSVPNDMLLSDHSKGLNEFDQNAAKSKWAYFLNSNIDNFISEHPELIAFGGDSNNFEINSGMLDKSFPFWRKENTPDFLGSYLNKSEKVPNLVFVLVEGLGHAYSSPNGYVGNFTPFIDSLAGKSLYWENNLSSTGRTFGVLPTITGSLPFGKNGFLEIEKTPDHFNLYTVLKSNGFETGFFYGGNSAFDRIKEFLEYSKVDNIIDQFSYDAPYQKLPASVGGESWGYEDQAVFGKMLQVQKPLVKPYFDIILTLSTHNPFLINNAPYYEKLFTQRVNSNQLSNKQKRWALDNKKQLVSVLNLDDALHDFFKSYRKREDFNNTIFVITGDHSMPEITLESKIDRYHVPLLVYSPLLKESKHFRNIVSHFDVAPSILAYYRENYTISTPSTVTWVGRGLSEKPRTDQLRIPLMQSKNQLIDYVYGKYHLQNNQLLLLNNLQENGINNQAAFNKANGSFKEFKNMNSQFYSTKKLMPDSVISSFMKKTRSNF